MTVVVDTSALVALVNAEPECEQFTDIIGTRASLVSMATLFEAHCVSIRSKGGINPEHMRLLIERLELTQVAFDSSQLAAARSAYTRYGRGSKHPAYLNMGDCFSYALAKTRNLPLLFKGNDFVHTDIEPAIAAG